MSLKSICFKGILQSDIRRFTKIRLHSSIMTHHRLCSMINMKDGISGIGTAYSVEVQVQYSTDSLSTMPSQSVT
jgi:hypothetical protein